MARVYYVDVAIPADRKKRGKHKTHVVFDGERTFKVRELIELAKLEASAIFIDRSFSELYDELIELLRKGVKVYELKDCILLKKLRIESNVKKSDEVDAMLLSRIPREMFRQLTVEELELKRKIRPLIRKYRRVMRWKKTFKRLMKSGFDYGLKEVIRLMTADGRRIARKIIRQVVNLPIYGEVYKSACEILGVKESAELAILTLELPLHLPMVRLKGLLGLTPDRNKGRYNHELRMHITNLAANLYIRARKNMNVSDRVAEIANSLPKEMALYRLQLIVVKALRIAYLMTVKPLAGEQ